MRSRILDWILDYVKDRAPELVVPVLQQVVLPYLREQSAKTQNGFDNYAVKQLERILADPEFLALLHGVGVPE